MCQVARSLSPGHCEGEHGGPCCGPVGARGDRVQTNSWRLHTAARGTSFAHHDSSCAITGHECRESHPGPTRRICESGGRVGKIAAIESLRERSWCCGPAPSVGPLPNDHAARFPRRPVGDSRSVRGPHGTAVRAIKESAFAAPHWSGPDRSIQRRPHGWRFAERLARFAAHA